MSVVRRCPSCGTTQDAAGECQTCHEAQVRYFCTNHDPGRWLDGPTCPACAAKPASTPPAPRTPDPPPPPARWDWLIRGAERAALDARPARGWLLQLIRRLAVAGLVALVAVVLAVYWLVRAL